MLTLETARQKAQKRKAIIDCVEEYDNAYLFSNSKSLGVSPFDVIVVFKESGATLTKAEINASDLGNFISTKQL